MDINLESVFFPHPRKTNREREGERGREKRRKSTNEQHEPLALLLARHVPEINPVILSLTPDSEAFHLIVDVVCSPTAIEPLERRVCQGTPNEVVWVRAGES
jgi:hypothetical protein